MPPMLADFLGEAPSAAAMRRSAGSPEVPVPQAPPLRRSEARRRRTRSPEDSPRGSVRDDDAPRNFDDDDRPPTPTPEGAAGFARCSEEGAQQKSAPRDAKAAAPSPAPAEVAGGGYGKCQASATGSTGRPPPRPRPPSLPGHERSGSAIEAQPSVHPCDRPDGFWIDGVGWCDENGRLLTPPGRSGGSPDLVQTTRPGRASSLPRSRNVAQNSQGPRPGRASSQPRRGGTLASSLARSAPTTARVNIQDMEANWDALGGI